MGLPSTTFMHYVYILLSKLKDQIYIGSTNDLKGRFEEHNQGKEISTKRYKPWKLIYYEAYMTEKLARLREKRLKHHGNALRELKKRVGLLKSGAGFTLTELLVYIALFSIIVVAVTQSVLVVLDYNTKDRSQELVLTSAIQAIDSIRLQARSAREVYAPTSVFSSHPGQLSLVTTSNTPEGEDETYVDFFVSDDERLCIKKEEQEHRCVTSPDVRVTNLHFIHLAPTGGPEAVQTLLTLKYRSSRPELQASYTIQSTDVIR